MEPINISSHKELAEKLKAGKRSFLLLYKSGSEQSHCALQNLREGLGGNEGVQFLAADVATVRDIHPAYNISTVPVLLVFEGSELKNTVKGCNDKAYVTKLVEGIEYQARVEKGEAKRVTVYSTPTCSWCTTLKNYLRQHKVRFRDVDVSRDQQAAQGLVNRTGQQGVPQTEINGQWVVGFDKQKINRLLEIQG